MHHSAAGGLHSPPTQMSSADTSVASLDPSFAEPRGRSLWRLVAPFAVAVALLSALLTFVVLTGLTRIQPTREVVQNSLIVARAYLYEHAELIRGDILGMANDISHARPLYDQDRRTFRELLTASAAQRNLPGAMLIDKERNVLETAQTGIQQAFTTPAPEFLSNVKENEPEISVFPEGNYVAAVIRLRAFNDTFLYVARLLDPHAVAQR